jgi:hypothetical protein
MGRIVSSANPVKSSFVKPDMFLEINNFSAMMLNRKISTDDTVNEMKKTIEVCFTRFDRNCNAIVN